VWQWAACADSVSPHRGTHPPPTRTQYHNRLCDYLNTFDKCFVVGADNVGSKQMSDIRAVRCVCLCV
jgi:hypothetical protein